MTKIILILVLLTSIFGCGNGNYKVERPKNLIEQNEFTDILYEVVLAESYLQSEEHPSQLIKQSIDSHVVVICKKHNTQLVDFNESMDYYSKNQEKIKSIYSVIIDSLNITK